MQGLRVAASALLLVGLAGFPAASAGEEPAPAPPPAQEEPDELERARAEEAAARERLARAEEEVRLAAARAALARRRAATEALVEAERALEAALDAGDAAAAAAAEERVSRLAAEVASLTSRASVRRAPAAAPLPRAVSLEAATRGLPPLRRDGGLPAEEGVPAALGWLARHQSPEGRWDADGFAARCREVRCPGPGGPRHDAGVTGLAVLPFLGAGETHKTPTHGETVRSALRWLKSAQDPEGCFGPRESQHFVYDHAIATLAMSEALGATQSPIFKGSAEAGVAFILSAQNPYLGWRYGVRPGDNDTSVTGWMVLALGSARAAGITVPDAAFEGALTWFGKVTEPDWGRAGYTARGNGPARPQELMDRFPADRSESMTAAAIVGRLVCRQPLEHDMIREGLDCIGRTPPSWDEQGSVDFPYWFFGTLATSHAAGEPWRKWCGALDAAVRGSQRHDPDTCAHGSWDPVDPWGAEGGRVYSTAMNALMLEIRNHSPKVIRVR
jgi:hypothetical protein